MLIYRWLAPVVPTKEQIKQLFFSEGLPAQELNFPSLAKVKEHRHPFDEILIVLKGQLVVNVSGNKFLLRPGDRTEIPSNTKHAYQNEIDEECSCLIGNRPF